MAGKTLIKLDGISISFGGVHALQNVDLEILEGQTLCLAGENGGGKSTLIKIISGFYRPDHGTIEIDGKQYSHFTPKQAIDLGTHMLFIAEVTDMDVLSEDAPATYAYYQEHIKPKPEAVGKTEDGKTVWRCRICGYEYVGEELPEDFICPICKHPASDFEKVG